MRYLLILLALAACEKKQAAPPASEKAEAPRPVSERQPRVVRKLAPITVEEVADFLPAPAGAREVKPVGKATVGERVEGAWCFDSGEPAALAARIQEHVESAGWTEVSVKANVAQGTRTVITGKKPPYALFGSLTRGKWAECNEARGQTYVQLGVHHVEATRADAPVAPGGRQELRAPTEE